MRMLVAGNRRAPTLATACAALPPEGAELRLGRPSASFIAPTLATACAALPPEGAELCLGRPGASFIAPTLATACAALPPEGVELRLGRCGTSFLSPTLSFASRRLARGFTLIELLVVVAIMAVATGGVSLALRDSSGAALEREGQRLAALLETARAQSRMTAVPVRWRVTVSGFAFDGLADPNFPSQWLSADTQATGAPVILLGPEPVIGPQSIRLTSLDKPGSSVTLATDGVRPFTLSVQPMPTVR